MLVCAEEARRGRKGGRKGRRRRISRKINNKLIAVATFCGGEIRTEQTGKYAFHCAMLYNC